MKIGIAQFDASATPTDNLRQITETIARLSAEGAELVVFPEGSMHMPDHLDDIAQVAQPLSAGFVGTIGESARRHGVAVIAGMWERSEGKVFNTVIALGADGALITSYRKAHLYDAFTYRESDFVTPSTDLAAVTFAWDSTTVGLSTCYDLRFPESSRILIDAGAEVILLPAAWVPGPLKEDQWLTLVRARAIENTCFVVAVNQVPPVGTGRSVVVDPRGVVVAELPTRADTAVVDLDLDLVAATRAINPSLQNRRFGVSALR